MSNRLVSYLPGSLPAVLRRLPVLFLLLIPPMALVAQATSGPAGLIAVSVVLPLCLAILCLRFDVGQFAGSHLASDEMPQRTRAIAWLDTHLASMNERRRLAVLAVSIDRLDQITDAPDGPPRADVKAQVVENLRTALRKDDLIVSGDVTDFIICLARVRAPQRETVTKLARRLQASVDTPVIRLDQPVFPTLTIGIATSRHAETADGAGLVEAAETAHETAGARGSGAICDNGNAGLGGQSADGELVAEVARALENGQITAWYQPQLSTDTGEISGMEALARWEHPVRGVISPASFLPLIERAGLSQRLAQVVMTHALSALRTWDRAGLDIPGVGVNFSADELQNPHLTDFIRWELDRFELAPDRLVIEVLESVISEGHDDAVARNLRDISGLGCRIDLDDFGTGFTSIINIRRFNVSRIKIDRRLVTGVDREQDQRDLVAALLAMSDHLKVDTLGEGVETREEHLTLAQLGCGHVQGFAIARPMPLGDTIAWAADHRARIDAARNVPLATPVAGREK